jgi:spermidine synthase
MQDVVFIERDPFSPIRYAYEVEGQLHRERSQFQEILVLDLAHFGRALVLDGVIQLTERDEHIYHEMLTQVVLHSHPSPESVLIIGGGDGGSLREVAKHETVTRIDLVELDPKVVEVCRRFLPTVATSFDDPRLSITNTDGAQFLKQADQRYDLVIVDCTDPVGPAQALSTREFFADCLRCLKPEGMFVAQTESLHFHRHFVADVQRHLSQLFPIADLYTAALATYAGNWWTFSVGSMGRDPRTQARMCQVPARYYSDDVHAQSFLPGSLYRKLMQE